MRRRVIGLFVANMLTFVIVGVSFIVYSKLLSPAELGLYAAALSLATVLALVLDGGLKTSVIKMGETLTKERESSIALLMVTFSLCLILFMMAAEKQVVIHYPDSGRDIRFTFLFVSIALLFYPFFTLRGSLRPDWCVCLARTITRDLGGQVRQTLSSIGLSPPAPASIRTGHGASAVAVRRLEGCRS